jgi:hypothetical protein
MFEIHDGPQFSSIVSDQGSKTLNSSRLICRGNAATIYDEETVRLLLSSVNVRCGPQAMHYAYAEAVMIDSNGEIAYRERTNEADYNAADAAPTTWELFKRIANANILENDTPTSMTQWRMIMTMMMPSSDRMYSGRSFKI